MTCRRPRWRPSSISARSSSGRAPAAPGRSPTPIAATSSRPCARSSATGAQATAVFRSTRVIPSAAGGAIEGTLTLNGRSQPVRLQLTAPAPGRYRGTVTIVQSAFGIKPYSGFFGALKLRDEVVAEFEVDLGRAA